MASNPLNQPLTNWGDPPSFRVSVYFVCIYDTWMVKKYSRVHRVQVAIPWLSPHTLQVDHKLNDKVLQMQRHYEQSRLTDRRTDVSSGQKVIFFWLGGAVVFFLIPNPI